MAQDFTMKQHVDVTGIAALIQRKQIEENQAKEQQRQSKQQEMQQLIQSVGGMVSTSIEQSKARQKADMVKNLADSAVKRYAPDVSTPQMGPTTAFTPQGAAEVRSSLFPGAQGDVFEQGDGAPLPNVATPNPNADFVRSMVTANPTEWTKQVANDMFGDNNSKAFAPQQGSLELKGGKIIPAVFKDGKYFYANTDQLIPPEAIVGKGFKPSLADNPYSGDKMNVTASGAAQNVTGPAAAQPGELKSDWTQLTPKRRAAVETAKKDFDSSPTVSAMTTRLQKFDETQALLETKNWVGDAALGAFIARTVASEVGNLNQQEQEIYRMSPEVIRKLETKAHRWANGTITEADRADIQKVLDVSKAKTLANLDKEAGFHSRRLHSKMKDVDYDFIKSNIYEGEYRQPKAAGGMDLGDGFSFTVR